MITTARIILFKDRRRRIWKKSKIGLLCICVMALSCSRDPEVEKPDMTNFVAKAQETNATKVDLIVNAKKTTPLPYYTHLPESYPRIKFFIIAGEYLWILNRGEMRINNGGTTRILHYNTCNDPFPYTEEASCIPFPRFFGRDHLKFRDNGLNQPKNFGVFDEQVIITLGSKQYYFTFDGTFLKRRTNEDPWWEITMPPYEKSPWKIEYNNFKIVSHKKHKYRSIIGQVFSGPWVMLVKRDHETKYETVELMMADRKTGEIMDVYKDVKRSRYKGYFREYGHGFYLDKLDPSTVTGRYSGTKRPHLWYGIKKINLESSDDSFCYVLEEQKKCVSDPGRKLFEVVETDTMRLFIDNERIWVERFSKNKPRKNEF